VVAEYLQGMGYAVIKAQSGPQALKLLLARDDLHLAILDVFMQGLTGIEVLAQFRKSVDLCETREIPVIVITSDFSAETELRARMAKADIFLLKPFTKEALAEIVAQLTHPC